MPEQAELLAALLEELSRFKDPVGVKQVLEHRVEPFQADAASESAPVWVFARIPISEERVAWSKQPEGERWLVMDDEGNLVESFGPSARLEELWNLYAYHVCCVDAYEKLLETAHEKKGSILVADVILSRSTRTELTPDPREINVIVTDRAGREWRFDFFKTATVPLLRYLRSSIDLRPNL